MTKRAAWLTNAVTHTQYGELCELLGDNDVALWRKMRNVGEMTIEAPEPWLFVDGEPMPGKSYRYGVVQRVYFDLDWEEYMWIQVWDHNADEPRWEHVLLFLTGANEWYPEQVWSWGEKVPSYAEAGAKVDEHVVGRRGWA